MIPESRSRPSELLVETRIRSPPVVAETHRRVPTSYGSGTTVKACRASPSPTPNDWTRLALLAIPGDGWPRCEPVQWDDRQRRITEGLLMPSSAANHSPWKAERRSQCSRMKRSRTRTGRSKEIRYDGIGNVQRRLDHRPRRAGGRPAAGRRHVYRRGRCDKAGLAPPALGDRRQLGRRGR